MFKVVGTGFLVRDTTVITNGHVINDLRTEQGKEHIPDAQLFLSFVVPRRNGPLGIAFGYPHGSSLSEKDGRLRWGPVLQQGWVSGVSPYEGSGAVDEILLNLRAEEGMSGLSRVSSRASPDISYRRPHGGERAPWLRRTPI